MMKKNFRACLILGSLFLTACSTFQSTSSNQAICNEVKHQIIFNGATGDPQEAMQQRAELGNLNQTYRAEGCS